MSLRVKLLALFTLMVVAAIGVMDWGVERYARQQFQEVDQQRSGALVAQFQQELAQRAQEVSSNLQGIADAESTTRMVLDLSRPQADASLYANDARGLAEAHQLDYLELANNDGTLISVAQWPEQVGYKNDWVTRETDWNKQPAFLDRVELADSVELGLLAVRVVHVGDQNFYIIGGKRIDRDFLQALALPAGMRALLYRNLEDNFVPAALTSSEGPVPEAERFAPLIESAQKQAQGTAPQTIQWTSDPASTEKFAILPLNGRHGELAGALLLGSSQSGLISLLNYVRGLALVIAAAAILVGFLMSWWIGMRVSRPLTRLAGGIDEVAAGDWDAQVEVRSGGEIAGLLRSFNRMADRLTEERGRMLTTERVAAWREMAQQLAGEVQAGIAPLQKAVVKLGRAHEENSGQFDEVFFESLATLRVELKILQVAAEGLVDFARMPEPHFEALRINDVIRTTVKSFEPQFCAIGRPPITPELYLDDEVTPVRADPLRIQKVVESLLYRALMDMPAGGTLTIRTKQQGDMVHLVVADTGRGFEIAQQDRIFSMQPAAAIGRVAGHGAGTGQLVGEGLILATVQAIVSDHGGRISVESAPGAGTSFFVDLPAASAPPASRPSLKQKKAKLEIPTRPAEVAPEAIAEPAPEAAPDVMADVTVDMTLGAEAVPESTSEMATPIEAELPAEAPAMAEAEVTLPDAVPEQVAKQVESSEGLASETQGEFFAEAPEMSAETAPVVEVVEVTEADVTSHEPVPESADLPAEVRVEISPEPQSQFFAEAPEASLAAAEEHLSIVEAIRKSVEGRDAALEEALHEVEVEEQRGAQPSSQVSAPEEALGEAQKALDEAEKAAQEAARVQSEEKQVWRSPLTYR